MRSAEDVYHDGQRVEAYTIEALVGTKWRNATSRGGTVGVGTIDMHHPNPGSGEQEEEEEEEEEGGGGGDAGAGGVGVGVGGATKLRWRCLAAVGGAPAVTLTAVDLYLATPPS